MQRVVLIVAFVSLCSLYSYFSSIQQTQAQTADPRYYDIGSPTLVDLWLDPVNGNDNNDGSTREQALRTLTAAWNRIPANTPLTTNGYQINILPGSLPCAGACSNYFAQRLGTYQFPVIIRAAEGRNTVTIQGGLNLYGVQYLYLIDLNLIAGGDLGSFSNNVLHLERADHVLMRGLVIHPQSRDGFQEALKANQCQYLYLEDSDVSTATNAAVDYVAVQYGHVVGNQIHDAGNWAIYLKGGSAYFRVEANEIYDSWFGFAAGEGVDIQFMQSPWLHYEAYDIKFINNVLHDLPGTGLDVSGGYNILLANNTLYRTAYNNQSGRSYGLITMSHGLRACNGTQEACQAVTDQGTWGPNLPGYENNGQAIPNRNVYIYNNVFYNPAPYQTYYGHFVIYSAAVRPDSFQNLPDSLPTEQNLQIRGNLIWNGPADHPLGIEGPNWGCQPSNPTCNPDQLRADNTINTVEPQFYDPDGRDFRLKSVPGLTDVRNYPVPDFNWDDAPTRPAVPPGNLSNIVDHDRSNFLRTTANAPGAYTIPGVEVVSAANYKNPVAVESLVAAFGNNLAFNTTAASSSPLPTVLDGTSVSVTDSAGTARLSPLCAVSPTQVNYQIPPGTVTGQATVKIVNSNGSFFLGRLQIENTAPGIFTTGAEGLPIGSILRVREDGSQQFEPVAQFDQSQNRYVPVPIDLSHEREMVFLVLYATGVRHRSSLSAVKTIIGGVDSQVLYAGEQGAYAGLDQLNIRLLPSLNGRGEVAVALTVDGKAANTIRVSIH